MNEPKSEPQITLLGRYSAEVETLREHVDHLALVLDTERATSRRFRLNIGVLIFLSAANLFGLGFAYSAAHNAQQGSHTLQDCLIPGGGCAKRLAQQGVSGAVRQMDYQACWASVPIEARRPSVFEDCKQKILEQVISNEGGK